ncbi:pyridoxamine 5'-phosphate oxidase [Comamonadaceae bacterium OH2545_COT-014]|nr:pyridoxamine 5'-phosphate oxidase [Comamonadaceae bacterium OH2545_COT-014]
MNLRPARSAVPVPPETPDTPAPHEPRLMRALRELLHSRRTAALGTLDAGSGLPFVSMTPFAIDPALPGLVLHVSGLAAHTRNVQASPSVSLLIAAAEAPGQPVHALPRVSLEGQARLPAPGSPEERRARAAYLARFPEAETMTALPDFRFVTVRLARARHVAGFGAARTVEAGDLAHLLATPA